MAEIEKTSAVRGCAICREQNVQFSIEHVIPEALGGYYVLNDVVCINCNSKLGSQVDGALVNHWITKLFRFTHNLGGKSKKPPNPFDGHFTTETGSNRQLQIRIDNDGRLVPYLLPNVTYTDLGNDLVQVDVSLDGTDEANLNTILSKIAKRTGLAVDKDLARGQLEILSEAKVLKGRKTVNLRDFKLGLLKIAYEFAIDHVPGYFESEDAKKAAKLLKEARFDDVEQYVNIGNGFDHSLVNLFAEFLSFGDKKHYLILYGTSDSLLCFVYLQNLFTVGVTLSTRSFGYFVKFGVNDFGVGTFVVRALEEIPLSIRYRPQLYIQSAQDAVAFKRAEKGIDFDFEREDGSWILFQHNGTRLGLRVDDLIARLEPDRSEIVDGQLIYEYRIPEGIYLRPQGWSSQVQVCGFRTEYAWEKL